MTNHKEQLKLTNWQNIVKTQNLLTADLYNQRQELVSSIDGFWALVFEQASSDIDTYIQAADSQVFAEALASIDVKRFEIPPYLPSGQEEGSPRSIKISFHFKPNKWFHDAVIEKYFWHRQGKTGWVGLVSEPVNIRWKQGMDLTEGLLDAAFRAYKAEVDAGVQWKVETDVKKPLPEQLSLTKKIEAIPDGGRSFFNFFGFRGYRVSKEESAHVEKNGPDPDPEEAPSEGEAVDDFDDDNKDMPREIFPDGEDLAIAISEDLWTDALKYFSELTLFRKRWQRAGRLE